MRYFGVMRVIKEYCGNKNMTKIIPKISQNNDEFRPQILFYFNWFN